MNKGYFVYRETKGKALKEYWNRKDGRFEQWFTKSCIYPTYKGADRQAQSLIKEPVYFKQGTSIGVKNTIGI